MSYSIEITEIAEQEIIEINNWYKAKQVNLANRFELNFKNTIQQIQTNPFTFQKRYLEVRIVFIKTFPFGIHYIVNDKIIVILSVYHTSREPK